MSLYRNIIWFSKGMLEYTKGGYEKASKSFKASDLNVDCSGQAYMVTGANSGLGKAIATDLARRGGTVHMVCRNEERAQKAKQEIINETKNENIHLHIVDMSEPVQVQAFAEKFSQSSNKLNVLINNAGCMVNAREVNSKNMELNFATNTLGVYILTTLLIPLLSKTVEPRVVTISSGGMLVQKLDLEDLQFEKMFPYDGTMAYAQTKRQQVIISERLADQYPEVHFSTVNPGWADTPGVQSSMSSFYERMKDRLRSPSEGADTAVWLSISKAALIHPSGLFYLDRKPSSTHLPLAWTKSSQAEDEKLIRILQSLIDNKFERRTD